VALLFSYHARLAVKSLRRDPGLSVTIVIVMAVVAGMFLTTLIHYLRVFGPSPSLPPGLHHVEVGQPAGKVLGVFVGTTSEPNAIAGRLRVSFPIYRRLAGSDIPVRQTGTFRSRLLVRRAGPVPSDEAAAEQPLGSWATAPPGRPRNARFVNADFFSMFRLKLREGAPWTREQEARGDAVAVLSKRLAAALFPLGDGLGASLLINEVPFRVVGICAEEQPMAPEWDRASTGGPQDLLYLPFASHRPLGAFPEMPIHVSPLGPRYADLLASDEIFVSYWLDLPTPEARRAYEQYLAATLGPLGVAYHLRDFHGLRAAFPTPRTAVSFFLLLTLVVLAGGGLIMARLLLAKGLARGDELGIFRALGAPRRSLFVRQLIEAALLSGLGGVLSVAIAAPQAVFYNAAVADTDIPLHVTPLSFLITLMATLTVGVLFALYPAWRAASRPPTISLGRH
jgi:putative ABC transport system permease protein